MVCETLVVAGGERGIHCVDGGTLPGLAEDLVENREVQRVDLPCWNVTGTAVPSRNDAWRRFT